MKCPNFDWTGYALEELAREERQRHAAHLAVCAGCREELAALEATTALLVQAPAPEPPRRIAFVSDPVLEPKWWERWLGAGPKWTFAGAAALAGAILAHGWMMRPAAPALTAHAAQIEQRVAEEVARRLPAAVDSAVTRVVNEMKTAQQTEMAKVSESLEKRWSGQRQSDQRELRSAFDYLERQFGTMYMTASRGGSE
jgi:hypothetical protein